MQALETERLLVRPFTLEDIPDAQREVYASPRVWGPRSQEYVIDSVTTAMLMAKGDGFPWAKRAVVLKEGNVFIGQLRLDPYHNWTYRWEEEPRPLYNTLEVELSFAFGTPYWGKGYAYEASRAMITYAFKELRLPRLVGGTGPDNVRSINLHRRLGYSIYKAIPLPEHEEWGERIVTVLNNNCLSDV
jgi:RimJ/RimL family protein N-acetyltransferase